MGGVSACSWVLPGELYREERQIPVGGRGCLALDPPSSLMYGVNHSLLLVTCCPSCIKIDLQNYKCALSNQLSYPNLNVRIFFEIFEMHLLNEICQWGKVTTQYFQGNNAQVVLTVHKYSEAKTTGCLPKGDSNCFLIHGSCFAW